MITYKITAKRQWIQSWDILVLIFGCIGIYFYMVKIKGAAPNDYYVIRDIIGIFSFFFIPQLALHIDYLLLNRLDELTYDEQLHQMTFRHKGKEIKFHIGDIKEAIHYKSFALHKGNIQLLPWDSYNHVVLTLSDGKKITITSLMTGGKIDIPIEDKKIVIKMNYYRWASGPSLKYT